MSPRINLTREPSRARRTRVRAAREHRFGPIDADDLRARLRNRDRDPAGAAT